MRASPSTNDDLQATRNLGAKVAPETLLPENERKQLREADLTRDDLTGLAFGPYVLGAKLGGGGMGKVFLARHVHLGKEFALKFITAAVADSPEARLRFEQEVKALGKLQHPNIVSAVDAGCIAGVQYLATERIDGLDLWQVIKRRGPLSIADACELMRQAALGLAHSHASGIVHRDIKPANLILDRQGVVKILDFGLVRATQSELTMDGAVLGTLDFLAPEQAQDARSVDQRSDLYSLGCTLVHLLSGRPPFHGEQYATPASKIKGHLLNTPDWLNDAAGKLPRPLMMVLRRLLAKKPGDRFATAQEVADLLAPFCHGQQIHRLLEDGPVNSNMPQKQPQRVLVSRRSFVGAGVAAACLLLAGFGVTMWSANEEPQLRANSQPATAAATAVEPAKKLVVESPVNRPSETAARADLSPEHTTTTQTTEPKKTANAAAFKVNLSAAPQKNEFQPLSNQGEEPNN